MIFFQAGLFLIAFVYTTIFVFALMIIICLVYNYLTRGKIK